MKRHKALVLVLFLILTGLPFIRLPLHSQELGSQEIYKKAIPAIVEIFIYDKEGEPLGNGTGFFIGPGRILTAFHVVDDAYSISFDSDSISEPKLERYQKITILKYDAENDLALLKADPVDSTGLSLIARRESLLDYALLGVGPVNSVSLAIEDSFSNPIAPSQKVVTIGNPGDFSFALSNGIISVRDDYLAKIMCTLPVGPGYSGGPLLRENGKVIGVCKGRYYGLSVFVDWRVIKQFLKRRDRPRELLPAGSIAPRSKNIFMVAWRAGSRFVAKAAAPVIEWLWKASGRFVQFVGVFVLIGLILLVLLILARLAVKASHRKYFPANLAVVFLIWIIILNRSPDLMASIFEDMKLVALSIVAPTIVGIVLSVVFMTRHRTERKLKAESVKANPPASDIAKRGARGHSPRISLPPPRGKRR